MTMEWSLDEGKQEWTLIHLHTQLLKLTECYMAGAQIMLQIYDWFFYNFHTSVQITFSHISVFNFSLTKYKYKNAF